MAITVKHLKVSTVPDAGDDTLVEPSDWNADHTITGTVPVENGGTGAATLTGYVKGNGTAAMTAASTIPNTDVTGLGTMSTQNANNVAITGGSISGTTVSGYIPTTEKGTANGVATLDAGGKVPVSELPAAVLGALSYQGTWDASTNTPTLTSSVGTKGYYYVVSVAGNTNLNGITDWLVGDWAVYNGSVWQKVDNTETVTSVNGQTGAVVLTTTNIAEGTNEYFTQARARQSISAGTGISYDNTTGVVTNSAPDQIVALTGAGTTTISGTYPNFTITSNDEFDGDVVGPASATDNAIARFDTTTGKLIQNSVVTVSDTGAIAGATTITDLNYLDFDTTYSAALQAGQLGWNGNDTLGLGMIGGNVVQHIGEDTYLYIKASATITKGQVIMFTGAVGASGVLTGAPATGVTVPQYIIGVAAEDIANNAFGLVQNYGELTGLNTNGFNEGDVLFYDSAVTGGLTSTYPASGVIVFVAAVAKKSAGGGVLFIRIGVSDRVTASTGISVSQTNTGVVVTNTAPDQTVSISAGTGISTSGTYPNFTVTNTAPDQTVSITGAGTTSVTGTYPNFTVTSNDQYVGTVTSVAALTIGTTGTDLSSTVANGTTTPVITLQVPTASAVNRGALSAADWSTFNGKANAFTYTTNYIPYGQGTTTPNQNANFTFDGTTQTAPVQRASNGIITNSKTISASYTIPATDNAMSAGPVTIASGQTVTVSSGSRWVVL